MFFGGAMATTETEISLRGDKRGGTLQRGSWRQEASNISLESQILLSWNPEYKNSIDADGHYYKYSLAVRSG